MTEANSHIDAFKSRRGPWITVFIWSSALLIWLFSYGIIITEGPISERLFGASITFIIGLVAPWFWFTTRYRVSETTIHLQCGMLQKELKLQDIQRITFKGDGSGYSFALSRDSIHIAIEGSARGYKISPLDVMGFMAAIGRRCPHLVTEGEDLVIPETP